jgi:hypothetical protein
MTIVALMILVFLKLDVLLPLSIQMIIMLVLMTIVVPLPESNMIQFIVMILIIVPKILVNLQLVVNIQIFPLNVIQIMLARFPLVNQLLDVPTLL